MKARTSFLLNRLSPTTKITLKGLLWILTSLLVIYLVNVYIGPLWGRGVSAFAGGLAGSYWFDEIEKTKRMNKIREEEAGKA